MILNVIKIFFPAIIAFIIGILITPFFSHYFYKYKMWRKTPRSKVTNSTDFNKIYNGEGKMELSTPRIGGIIIWGSVLLTIFVIFLIFVIYPTELTHKMEFLSRNQTIIPIFVLIFASLLGLIDDFLQIFGKKNYAEDPISYRWIKVSMVIFIGFLVGLWFFYKLGVSSVHIPFGGELELGLLFIPFFILVMLGTFSSSVIDGIDGLSGGVLATIFASYTIIAFFNNQIDLAAFCAVVTGAILAFLWFNISPARFYMGETGILGLTVTLAVVAFLTESVLVLPIIALPLVLTSGSVLIQWIYRFLGKGKKIFRIVPLHHHLEVIGWSRTKITMRFWIISIIFSIIGTMIALIS